MSPWRSMSRDAQMRRPFFVPPASRRPCPGQSPARRTLHAACQLLRTAGVPPALSGVRARGNLDKQDGQDFSEGSPPRRQGHKEGGAAGEAVFFRVVGVPAARFTAPAQTHGQTGGNQSPQWAWNLTPCIAYTRCRGTCVKWIARSGDWRSQGRAAVPANPAPSRQRRGAIACQNVPISSHTMGDRA